jgi:hypothetical protein
MTEHRAPEEDMLVQLLRANLPPARDPLFRIDVLERLERRRFRRQLVLTLTVGPIVTVRSLVSSLLARLTQTISRALVD